MGTGIALAVTVMKFRGPGPRRRALALLKPPMQGFFKCTLVALLAEILMKLEEGFTLALREMANSRSTNSPGGNIKLADHKVSEHENTAYLLLLPKEARICGYGVFRTRTGLPLGIKENEVARWARNPDQIFLEFTKNCFDAGTVTWKPYSECIPLE